MKPSAAALAMGWCDRIRAVLDDRMWIMVFAVASTILIACTGFIYERQPKT